MVLINPLEFCPVKLISICWFFIQSKPNDRLRLYREPANSKFRYSNYN